MNEKPTIITERVDDIPLLLAQMDRMGLAEALDTHFATHGNWQGLSFGQVTTIWLSAILSQGDHWLVHVEPWVAQRQMMLGQATGGVVRAQEGSDDRLTMVLRLLSDDHDWVSCESALNQHLVRVSDLQAERVHVDSPSASVYASVSDDGLLQFGHSKDHRRVKSPWPSTWQGRARVAKARAQVEALNQRGRGRQRFEEVPDLCQAVNAIVQRHPVEDFLRVQPRP